MAAYLRLFGSPAVLHQGERLELPAGKTGAILCYLAHQEGWVSRSDLLYLFWPDTVEHRASQNLRPLLTKIRRLPFAEDLQIEATRLCWAVPTDVQEFRQAIAERRWAQAVQHHEGELLQGLHLAGAPEFESWLEFERQDLQESWRQAVISFALELEETRRYAESAQLLGRLHKSDPFDEDSLQSYLRALYLSGERRKALQVFESFRQTLEQELGEVPQTATMRLLEQIRQGEALATQTVEVATHSPRKEPKRPHPLLPMQLTPFIGRGSEKARITAQLAEPACRLLTLVALGGMGKTRLAMQVAAETEPAFAEGAVFVPFATVGSAELMVTAIAGALGFAFFGTEEPKLQLLDYLADKEMLLVFDNLEHLPAGALIAEVLTAAPRVKILATSREPLNLHAEWVFDLEGLSYPSASYPPFGREGAAPAEGRDGPQHESRRDITALQTFDAVRLFVQAAKRGRADFLLDASNVEAVAHICRLVEGMPLALELAASWLRLLSPQEIAAEMEQGLDLLESSSQDMPSRHRSIRAVFEHSWTLLSDGERAALRKLNVFHGGFTKEAAADVAGVGLPLLLSLVNKSFLKRLASGRFTRHPLIRQYIGQETRGYPEEQEEAGERHGAYFMAFVEARAGAFNKPQGEAMFNEIEVDLDNVEAAWRWAAEHGREDWLDSSLDSLRWFYFARSWPVRWLELLRCSQEHVKDGSLLHARLLGSIGAALKLQGHRSEAVEHFRQALTSLEGYDAKGEEARLLRSLGVTFADLGPAYYESAETAYRRALTLFREVQNFEGVAMMLNGLGHQEREAAEAVRLFEEGIDLSREKGQPHALGMTLDSLARLLLYQLGDYPAAKAAVEEAVVHLEETGKRYFLTLALNLRASVLTALGEYEPAEAQCLEVLELCERLNRRLADETRAEALEILGTLAHVRGELDRARALCQQSYQLSREFGASHFLAASLERLGRISLAQGQLTEAEGHGQAAWALLEPHPMHGGQIELSHLKVSNLGLLGEIALQQGNVSEAERRFKDALSLVHDWVYIPATLSLFSGLSTLLLKQGRAERATELLFIAAEHPAATHETRNQAACRLEEIEPALTTTTRKRLKKRSKDADLQVIITKLLQDTQDTNVTPG